MISSIQHPTNNVILPYSMQALVCGAAGDYSDRESSDEGGDGVDRRLHHSVDCEW